MEVGMSHQTHFADKQNVYQAVREARCIFGSTQTTLDQWETMERVLAMVYLYCPEELQALVLSTLDESGVRKSARFLGG